jgi:hypothetical protein
LRKPGSGALTLLLAAAAWSLTGCALVQDLSSNPYHLAEGGAGEGGCTGDAGCPLLAALSEACLSAANCAAGQVCCLMPTTLSSGSTSCEQPSACSSPGSLSFQLCASTGECPSGDGCTAQQCTFGEVSVMVHACTTIPFCKAL